MTKYNVKIYKNTIALKNDSTASMANISATVLIVFLKFLFIILFVYVVEKIGYYDKNKQQIEKIKRKLLFFCV